MTRPADQRAAAWRDLSTRLAPLLTPDEPEPLPDVERLARAHGCVTIMGDRAPHLTPCSLCAHRVAQVDALRADGVLAALGWERRP